MPPNTILFGYPHHKNNNRSYPGASCMAQKCYSDFSSIFMQLLLQYPDAQDTHSCP